MKFIVPVEFEVDSDNAINAQMVIEKQLAKSDTHTVMEAYPLSQANGRSNIDRDTEEDEEEDQ
jgi:hypothetical protein